MVSLINKNTMKKEIDPDIELDRIDYNSGDKIHTDGYKLIMQAKQKIFHPKWNNGQSLAM